MAELIRFHLDESADRRIATGLRRRERDCTTSDEAELLASSDEDQFAYAVKARRVLITRDHDFRAIAIGATEHPGVVICKRKSHFGNIIKKLDRLASDRTAEQVRGQVFYF